MVKISWWPRELPDSKVCVCVCVCIFLYVCMRACMCLCQAVLRCCFSPRSLFCARDELGPCAICQEPFLLLDHRRVQLPCAGNHVFHRKCVKTWLKVPLLTCQDMHACLGDMFSTEGQSLRNRGQAVGEAWGCTPTLPVLFLRMTVPFHPLSTHADSCS